MVTVTHAYLFPLVVAIWTIDAYVFLIGVRLVARQLPAASTSTFTRCLAELVDPIPARLRRWLSAGCRQPVREWVAWLIVIALLLVARHLVLRIMMAAM
jgi:uncharacterized protein YggT (Ycf19 family)